MDTTNLKLRHHTYFVRYVVPRPLRALLGKTEILRSLKTRNLAEARARRHKALHEIIEEVSRMALSAALPKDSAQHVIEVARGQREALLSGQLDEQQAEAGLDAAVETYLDHKRRAHGIDTDGDPLLPVADEQALALAHKVFRGEEIATLKEQITRYLRETKPRITQGAYAAKDRQLAAFAKWAGPHVDVSTITRKVAGKYVADVVQTADLAIKTKKSWLGNLAAFGAWLETYGIIEVNPWSNLSRALKDSKRGGTRPQPRPYTVDEFVRLLGLLPEGTPLLPMTCIAAYSGLRIDELASMKLDDIAPGALRVLQAKNENSVRYVPIHPNIVPMIEHLKETSTDGYLISGLLSGGLDDKRSHFASKAFGRFLRKHKFDVLLNFHSLRRSFAQRAETAGIPESTTALLTGHARQSLTYGLYSPGPEFPTLTAEIQKVTYGTTADNLVLSLSGRCRITKRMRRRHRGKTVEER